MLKTSATHPLRIAELPLPEGAGAIGVTFCPGKHDPQAHDGAWSRDLPIDLGAIRAWGANALVTLLVDEEFEQLGVRGLGDMAESAGLEWHHLPIPDMQPPGWQFERRWLYSGTRLRRLLRRGGRVVLHCRAGLGRAGTVAARLLVELGVPPAEAIARVREVRKGAIQTHAQERHVQGGRRISVSEDARVGHRLACLLGGALGDAFGYAVEFDSLAAIQARHGPSGLREPVLERGQLLVSDDTQMTLFTLEGLARARQTGGSEHDQVESMRQSYFDWLDSQGEAAPDRSHATRLLRHAALHVRRAPGNTCLTALKMGGHGTPQRPINDSKGSGGVMRMAPAGLLAGIDRAYAFRLGVRGAALTHGHAGGYLPAGVLSATLHGLLHGQSLQEALLAAMLELRAWPGHEAVQDLLHGALRAAVLAGGGQPPPNLGSGWVGDEALAIAIYAAARTRDFREALAIAANHDGDSDTTASLAGQICAAREGPEALPQSWVRRLDVLDAICDVADWSLPLWRRSA